MLDNLEIIEASDRIEVFGEDRGNTYYAPQALGHYARVQAAPENGIRMHVLLFTVGAAEVATLWTRRSSTRS